MNNTPSFALIVCALAVGLLAMCPANAQTLVAESGFNNSSGIADPESFFPYIDLDGQGGTGLGWMTPWSRYRTDTFLTGSTSVDVTTYYEGDQAIHSSGGLDSLADWCTYARAFTAQTENQVLIEYAVLAGEDFENIQLYVSDFDNNSVLFEDYNTSVGISLYAKDGSLRQRSGSEWITTQWGAGSMEVGN
ncbi:MAG: hypothetical protein JW818_22975 [Pirellulales bacterium]|nr:hypothetical protein [Pirellulales bacterium]